jgi:hypothetical protein
MPEHKNLRALIIVRPTVQTGELKNPAKHDVAERQEHEPSSKSRQPTPFYPSPLASRHHRLSHGGDV